MEPSATASMTVRLPSTRVSASRVWTVTHWSRSTLLRLLEMANAAMTARLRSNAASRATKRTRRRSDFVVRIVTTSKTSSVIRSCVITSSLRTTTSTSMELPASRVRRGLFTRALVSVTKMASPPAASSTICVEASSARAASRLSRICSRLHPVPRLPRSRAIPRRKRSSRLASGVRRTAAPT